MSLKTGFLPRLVAGLQRRRVAMLLAVAVAILAIGIGSGFTTFRSISADTDLVEHTMEVETAINRAAAFNERIETARRGFLLQPDIDFIRIVRDTQKDFDRELVRIEELTGDNDIQQQRIAVIRQSDLTRRPVIEQNFLTPMLAAEDARRGGMDHEVGTLQTRAIRATLQQMRDTEAKLLSVRNQRQLSSLRQFYLVAGLSLLALLAILVSVIVLVLRYNHQLTRAESQLRSANEGLEAAVQLRTAELTRANQEIQRFAYIVSHDLRSPLVNVLGFTSELEQARKTIRAYLEKLFAADPGKRDEQTWLAVDEDLPEAVGFIRTSTEKMDRLINSILELSRQGRRQLNPELLDMNGVIDTIVISLHQRIEDAGADVVAKPIPELESDRIAVEQILSNLVENALKYLSPARKGAITIEGSRSRDRVLIDVIDNGRGIAPADHERIFELFRRAGSQDQAGEGIGLANVRALAYRLGGTVEVQSELDEGARFRLSLPAKFVSVETLA